MPQPLDNIAYDLRAAVLASDHDNAQRFVVAYTTALHQYWNSLTPKERSTSELPKQAVQLLNWAREMTLMQKGITGQHLAIVGKASRYQTARAMYLGSASLDR